MKGGHRTSYTGNRTSHKGGTVPVTRDVDSVARPHDAVLQRSVQPGNVGEVLGHQRARAGQHEPRKHVRRVWTELVKPARSADWRDEEEQLLA